MSGFQDVNRIRTDNTVAKKRRKGKRQTLVDKTLHRKQKIYQYEPGKELGLSPVWMNSSCTTGETRRVTLVKTSEESHERRKEGL